MTEWRECKLGDVITFQRGYDLPKDKMVRGIYPVVASNGIIGFHNEYTTENPCVTIGRSGNVGNPNIVYSRAWAHNTTLYIREYKNCDPVFIYYMLHTLDLGRYASGSAVPTLNRNHIHSILISMPPLPEQKAIAEVLSSLDDKIDLLTRQNKTLEDLAQAYFRKWFIEDASNKWEKKSLGEIVTINYGKALPERERVSGKIPVYSSAGVTGWHNQYLVNSRGIVIGRKGTIGTIYWVPEPFYCIDTAYYITPEDSKYDLTFIYFLLKTMSLQDLNEDSAVPGLNRNTIYSQEFLQPPDDLICKFIRLSNTLLQKIQSNTAQIHALSKLRDTLLPKLISGEIRVKM